ncbi:thioredoxin family protein [soil metagenome]
MSVPRIVSPEEWVTARRALLAKEKETTKQRDLLTAERRELPMVEVTKAYQFDGPDGKVSLLDLFEGRRQLIVTRGYDEYNFRTLDEYAARGHESMKTSEQPYDMPGRSCFLEVNGRVFRTYSQYARGLETTGGSYYFLDLTALGRQEEWEEPKGRSEAVHKNVPDFAS